MKNKFNKCCCAPPIQVEPEDLLNLFNLPAQFRFFSTPEQGAFFNAAPVGASLDFIVQDQGDTVIRYGPVWGFNGTRLAQEGLRFDSARLQFSGIQYTEELPHRVHAEPCETQAIIFVEPRSTDEVPVFNINGQWIARGIPWTLSDADFWVDSTSEDVPPFLSVLTPDLTDLLNETVSHPDFLAIEPTKRFLQIGFYPASQDPVGTFRGFFSYNRFVPGRGVKQGVDAQLLGNFAN